ncbi:P22 coat protein - protein 5 domain protein [Deinococcus humi]|uniref:P22 coat protein-protein 5 domain protein n=1 Tax=Deinococcus humi TaxID=662880 RepID=A0A7W8JWK9_9DEIO|nr:P22 coat protein - protein 5 domain protein [Deinococcus humi]MBB5363086.1 hypothetical protein [Deinococcus humi]GGO24764.1 hypothetical protein GCM10008949_14000 [Deinococcus humi]
MSITVSDPIIWSARILSYLDKTFVYGAAFTNRNYEGEIKDAGSTVRILQIGDVTVGDYTGTLPDAQELTDNSLDLVVDQRKYFNFVVDDVDARRSVLMLVDEGSKRAAYAMSDVRDRFVASFHSAVNAANAYGTDVTPIVIGFGAGEIKPYDAFLELTQRLDEANVGTVDRRIVLPPWFVRAMKAQFGDRASSLGDNITENGMAGTVDGVKIFQSNNVANVAGAKYKVMAGLPVITFADAIVKTSTYSPEKKFGTGVKGLHVFGAKLLQSKAMAVGTFNKGQLSK